MRSTASYSHPFLRTDICCINRQVACKICVENPRNPFHSLTVLQAGYA